MSPGARTSNALRFENPDGARLGLSLAARKVEVTFPLGPDVCLLGTWADLPASVKAKDRVVEEFNKRRMVFADRYVFSANEGLARSALALYQDSARTRPE